MRFEHNRVPGAGICCSGETPEKHLCFAYSYGYRATLDGELDKGGPLKSFYIYLIFIEPNERTVIAT